MVYLGGLTLKVYAKIFIYFTLITQGVIAHSPEPEAHDQSV